MKIELNAEISAARVKYTCTWQVYGTRIFELPFGRKIELGAKEKAQQVRSGKHPFATGMKVMFDRSALHGERFDLLKGSPLLRRVQEGGIKVYYTIVFLEETLRMIASGRQNAKTELIKQWPFLRSICSGGWSKPLLLGDPPRLNSVCDEELNESPKHSGWPLVNPSVRDAAEARVDRLLRGSEPIPNMEAWQRSWDDPSFSTQKRKGQSYRQKNVRGWGHPRSSMDVFHRIFVIDLISPLISD